MSHGIIRAGGKQFLVEEGQTIRVPSVEAEAGSSIELETLLTTGEKKISATVVAHGKDQKIVVFKRSGANNISVPAAIARVLRP